MALTSTHGSLTRSVLEELGFSPEAQRIAAEANEKVDDSENQGSSAEKTNLHAMAGLKNGVWQKQGEVADAVKALMNAAKEQIVQSVRANRIESALKTLGAALHTQQDKAYHKYERWPFDSIVDAVVNFHKGLGHGLRPDYMLCHAVRDLSYVSALGYGAQYSTGTGWASTARLEVTRPSRSSWLPHLSAGVYYQQGGSSPGQEMAMYGLLSWGAPPGSVASSFPGPEAIPQGIPAFDRSQQICPEAAQGPASLLQARANSREYVLEIQAALGGGEWTRFRSFPSGAAGGGQR